MDIVLCPNNDYVFPTTVTLESIFANNALPLTFHIIHSGLTEENSRILNEFIAAHGGACRIYPISPDALGDLPVSIHITAETYYRLLAYRLLPESVERALYLDGDLVVNRSLLPLYETDFTMDNGKEALFVACEGPGVSQRSWKVYDVLSIPHDQLYCNAGVLVMNLAAMRREIPDGLYARFIAEHHEHLRFHDQDTINALFYDRIKYVDWHIWNQTVLHIQNKKEAKEREKSAAIIHYAGSDKPWKYDYPSWYMRLYWKYALKDRKNFPLCVKLLWKRILWHVKNS